MGLYCSREIFEGLAGLEFPAGKEKIVRYAGEHDAPEAALVMLHQLEDRVYEDIGQVCENARIACSLETARILSDLSFPADKASIIAHAWDRGANVAVPRGLELLPENVSFGTVEDVCERVA